MNETKNIRLFDLLFLHLYKEREKKANKEAKE